MNAKTLSAAMSLILSLAALSANAADASRIVDLPAVTVRPDAALSAELAANAPRVARIVDLPAVTVRPDAALLAELAADDNRVEYIVNLPAINVRPTAEQLAERAAIVATAQARALTAQLANNLLAEALVATLP